MDVYKYKIVLSPGDKNVNIPIKLEWDYLGIGESIDDYQNTVINQILGTPKDFETARFDHLPYANNTKTSAEYEFYFYTGNPTSVSATTVSDTSLWVINYIGFQGNNFIISDLYYQSGDFTNSFFKLDFYDNNTGTTQTNYLTIILPTSQGNTISVNLNGNIVNVNSPKFSLDYIGDIEGFFIYWLRNTKFLNISTFYVSAKFFNGKTGQFVKLVNTPQALISGTNKFNLNQERYFYYKVVLNYNDFTYQVFDVNSGLRVGITGSPIKWFEYVNPS